MDHPMQVLCIMDLSIVGRAGLAVAMPALASCGVQCCALPAALFSTHTGGFGQVEKLDTADFGQKALAHYTREGLRFDAVYIGYLYGAAQFALAERAIDLWPDALVVVDPALGDDGHLYSGITDETVARMRALAARAGLVTPNYTESALLCGQAPAAGPAGEEALASRMAALAANGSVIVTSVPTAGGGFETRGCGQGGADAFTLPSNRLPVHYPGSGDLFTAATLGRMLGAGRPLADAAADAARFVEAAVHATYAGGGTPRQGLWFEAFLPWLGPEGPSLALHSKTGEPTHCEAPQGCRAMEQSDCVGGPEGPSLALRSKTGEPTHCEAPQGCRAMEQSDCVGGPEGPSPKAPL